MKYLVTGAQGFLGSHLCKYLEKHNIDYTATARKSSIPKYFSTGDLVTFSDWPKLFNDIDVVVHTVAKVHNMKNTAELSHEYTTINFDMPVRLAKAAKEHQVKKFIFISTIKVNGENTYDRPFSADDKPNPMDEYALSKFKAENALMQLHEPGTFEVTILRPCLIYGSRVKANFQSLIELVKKQIPLPFGRINNKRSFVSVDNLTDLIHHCSKSPNASGQTFLVSDGEDLSLTDLIKLIARSLELKLILIPVPSGLMSFTLKLMGKSDLSARLFSDLRVDISKTKEVLSWTPPYSPADSFKKMLLEK